MTPFWQTGMEERVNLSCVWINDGSDEPLLDLVCSIIRESPVRAKHEPPNVKQSLIHCSGYTLLYGRRGLRKMKPNDPRRQKLDRQNH